MSSKYARTRPKRPIDKFIKNALTSTIAQTEISIRDADEAETLVRLIGDGSVYNSTGAALYWYLLVVLVRDGQTASTLDTASTNTVYAPEQDVLWIRTGYIASGTWNEEFHFDVKGMRKLRRGDHIYVISKFSAGSGSNSGYRGVFQGFTKQ